MIVFQPCIIFTNSLVGECEEDDPDPPEVTKHSKHDVAPICRTDIFPVSIPGVASSCRDSSVSVYQGNQAGNSRAGVIREGGGDKLFKGSNTVNNWG